MPSKYLSLTDNYIYMTNKNLIKYKSISLYIKGMRRYIVYEKK